MRRELLVHSIQQRRAGQQIEEVVGMNAASTLADSMALMLPEIAIIVHGLTATKGHCLGRTNSLPGRQLLSNHQRLALK
jgi:hypothetical protein